LNVLIFRIILGIQNLETKVIIQVEINVVVQNMTVIKTSAVGAGNAAAAAKFFWPT